MIQGIQGTHAYQQIINAQMLERAGQATTYTERQKIKDEFLAIFYKEILKQAFKPPKLGMSENDNSVMGMFSADVLLNQMALELAQSNAFSADNFFPALSERKIVTE